MKKLLIGVFVSIVSLANAQEILPCITDQITYQMKQQNPELALRIDKENRESAMLIQQFNENLNRAKKASVLIIPVVFHVIHQNGTENITQAQIMDQLRVLNEDFRKKAGTNGDKSKYSVAADMGIEFRLAQKDPNGNWHDGINRIESSLTTNAYQNVKSLIRWDPTKYLNVWVVKTIANQGQGTILGFAQFPEYLSYTPNTDGIVVRADYVGTIQTGNITNAGRTLTHEVGHWIGLYHTFQGGCVGNTPSTCASAGDFICDTPPVEDATFGCLSSRITCSDSAMVENYMDYMDGKCANTFTQGQKARALYMMDRYRSVVYSATNLQAAGLDASGNYAEVPASVIKAPYSYSFEDANITSAGWRIQNLNNGSNAWKLDNVAYTGNSSLGFRNFNITATLNTKDEFNSPLIDLSTLSTANLSFKVAYARKANNTNDILDVYISNDFGRTETLLFRGTTGSLESSSVTNVEFIPTAANQWRTISVDLTPYVHMKNARIRFEFSNRRGNNIFIDDFTISNSTGVNDNLKKEMAFNLIPNPMNEIAYAQFELKQAQPIEVSLYDITGRKVSTIEQGEKNAGIYSLPINRGPLSNGIYLLEVKTNTGSFTHKLVVN